MVSVAGHVTVDPEQREAYVAWSMSVASSADRSVMRFPRIGQQLPALSYTTGEAATSARFDKPGV
jgi:hypothetical protein